MADLRSLHPQLVGPAKWILNVGRQYDPLLVVTSARRDYAKQQKLYDLWRSGQSQIPAAPPGRSLHGHGLAFDLARIGKNPINDPLLLWLGEVWEWIGGRYGGVRDPVHFQVRV